MVIILKNFLAFAILLAVLGIGVVGVAQSLPDGSANYPYYRAWSAQGVQSEQVVWLPGGRCGRFVFLRLYFKLNAHRGEIGSLLKRKRFVTLTLYAIIYLDRGKLLGPLEFLSVNVSVGKQFAFIHCVGRSMIVG